MKLLKFLLSAFLCVSVCAAQAAPVCSKVMRSATKARIFSKLGLKIFKAKTSKREMVYDYQPGTQKKVVLLIHGLGDDMTKMEALADLFEKDGFGILRVDLHGHGMTLKRYLKAHDNRLPDELNYADNIGDLKEMIESLNIPELVIVGHSYGGGIAYGLASALGSQANGTKVESVHMLAPYVQRIDKFLSDYFKSPEFLLDRTAETIEKTGLPPEYVKTIMDPFFTLAWTMTSSMKAVKDYVTRVLLLDHTKDLLMDPLVESFMRKSYRKYFVLASKKKEAEMTPSEIETIDLKVEASIKVTKGIRSFDLLDQSIPLPSLSAPLQVIGGKKDSLVLPAQLQDFDRRLKAAQMPHELDFVEGENSQHLFPRLMAAEVYHKILDFMTRPNN